MSGTISRFHKYHKQGEIFVSSWISHNLPHKLSRFKISDNISIEQTFEEKKGWFAPRFTKFPTARIMMMMPPC